MFKDLLRNQEGIIMYPLFSMIVFVIFFIVLIIMTISYKKSYIDEVSNLPFDDNTINPHKEKQE